MTDNSPLLAVLASIRERGAIGEASLEAAIEHAEQFVAFIPEDAVSLVDLGSGGGLPGLVIAVRRPDLQVTLVERRTQRADLLRRAVLSLGLAERVSVKGTDVRTVATASPRSFDVVTARSFAAPEVTATWASKLLRAGGRLVVSEPPTDDETRWPASLLDGLGLVDMGREQGIRWFLRS
ncbi:MAG: putative ribosomal small subunit methyltransferase [Actinomycetota bacterium]